MSNVVDVINSATDLPDELPVEKVFPFPLLFLLGLLALFGIFSTMESARVGIGCTLHFSSSSRRASKEFLKGTGARGWMAGAATRETK